MKAAGIKIIYSIPGLKVHAKVALVKRWENDQWQHYSFMATGNLNEVTGRFYTDHVYFTTNKELSADLEKLFDYLQSRKQPAEYGNITFKHLLVSQFNLVDRYSTMIQREIDNAKAGRPASIIVKLNNLQEKGMIVRLYEAASAGVDVKLLVRSICCFAPGVKGQSEHVKVHRIVDRYLEHARILVFHNNGEPEYYLGSADWMNRNLYSRIEVCFPLYNPELRKEIQDILDLQLKDTAKAVWLTEHLENQRIPHPPGEEPIAAQKAIYNYVKKLAGF